MIRVRVRKEHKILKLRIKKQKMDDQGSTKAKEASGNLQVVRSQFVVYVGYFDLRVGGETRAMGLIVQGLRGLRLLRLVDSYEMLPVSFVEEAVSAAWGTGPFPVS